MYAGASEQNPFAIDAEPAFRRRLDSADTDPVDGRIQKLSLKGLEPDCDLVKRRRIARPGSDVVDLKVLIDLRFTAKSGSKRRRAGQRAGDIPLDEVELDLRDRIERIGGHRLSLDRQTDQSARSGQGLGVHVKTERFDRSGSTDEQVNGSINSAASVPSRVRLSEVVGHDLHDVLLVVL